MNKDVVLCKNCKRYPEKKGWCATFAPDDYCSYGVAAKGRYKWGEEYTEEEIARATVHKDDERHIVDITKLPFKIPTLWEEAEGKGLAIWNQLYDEFGGKEHVVSVIKQDPERKREETQDIWNRFDELFFERRQNERIPCGVRLYGLDPYF